jgi:superfamily I DNA and/or RNA helicase
MVTRDDAKAALDRLAALWRREREATHAAFVAQRANTTLRERVDRGIALRDLEIDEAETAPGGRTRLWLTSRFPAEVESSRIGGGDPVRLWGSTPDGADAVLAVVARRERTRISVVVEGEPPERLEEGRFHLDRDEPGVTFDRGDRAITRFRDAPAASDLGELRDVLFGVRLAEFDAEQPLITLDDSLNEPQRAAVRRALAARDVALVHGPPGTGKTRTLVEVIRQAMLRGERVLATAASNTAVDNLAERLVAAGVDTVRLGHPARVSLAMEAHTLDARLEATPDYALARKWNQEANALFRKARGVSRGGGDRETRRETIRQARALLRDARRHVANVQEAILARARVVCATATGADASLLDDEGFDLVVLDEATQAPDPCAFIALARARRAVLAGDPRQLPPTVVDADAAREGLATTLFERIFSSPARERVVRMLVVQHRMHAALMRFPSESQYEGKLVAAPEVAGHTLADLGVLARPILDDPLRQGPLVFVDTAGKGWEEERTGDDPSTSNPGQAERVAAEVRRLLSRGLAPSDVGLITPYDAQVRALRALLAAEWRGGLEIGSVDGFQGREKEAIVVDLVRSNPEGSLGFLTDTRRMNVALTRAKRFLLVVGDSATLGAHPYYAAFLAAAESQGAWVSAWSDDAPPLR